MSWNHKHYPLMSWNKEQDLNTACKIQLIGTSNVLGSNTKELYCDSTQAIKLW